jgi:putative 4-mercaptohistidine N1-methyltranferase
MENICWNTMSNRLDSSESKGQTQENVNTEAVTTPSPSSNVYESDDSLQMYYGLHYPRSGFTEGIPPILPHANCPTHGLNFPQRVAQLLCYLKESMTQTSGNNAQQYKHALDIGCAVGGASFELAKSFEYVDAFDYSTSFITAANGMKLNPESIRFRIPMEAEIYQEVQVMHDTSITESIRNNVNFFTGDACDMERMVNTDRLRTDYDGVIMANLLCRIPDPIACLNGLSKIVKHRGIVVIVSPYSWLEEYTLRNQWLGGKPDPATNEAIWSNDVLRQRMEERGFIKVHEEQIPLIIREHQRKYQYIISEATGCIKTSKDSAI